MAKYTLNPSCDYCGSKEGHRSSLGEIICDGCGRIDYPAFSKSLPPFGLRCWMCGGDKVIQNNANLTFECRDCENVSTLSDEVKRDLSLSSVLNAPVICGFCGNKINIDIKGGVFDSSKCHVFFCNPRCFKKYKFKNISNEKLSRFELMDL